ncbi:MAG: hypothetical protein AAF747_01845 [Planctomycetota bacterium]
MAKKTAKKTTKKKVAKKTAGKAAGKGLAAPEQRGARYDPPKPMGEIIGQQHARSVLASAMASGRVHHAWIFHGLRGVGKMTTALAFAAVLLDPDAGANLTGEIEADPASPTQQLLRAASHPDLHVVAKEMAEVSRDAGVRSRKLTTIPKEVVLEFLVEPAQRTRSSSVAGEGLATKVFIVDEAHLLGREAQNLLLKTLEEPPAGTVIMLVTPSEERLLPTIRSRCQRVAFGPLSDDELASWAATELEPKGVQVPGGAESMRFAGGSPGELLGLIEGGVLGWPERLEKMLSYADRGKFLVDLGPTFAELVSEHAEQAVAGKKNASKDAANRAAVAVLMRWLAERYRGLMARDAAGDPDELERHASAIDAITRAERLIATNVPVALVMDDLAAELAGPRVVL